MDTSISSVIVSTPLASFLSPSTRTLLDAKTAKEIVGMFLNNLRNDKPRLNGAFMSSDWEDIKFITEKLLGVAAYFDVPALQNSLDEVMRAACKQTLTQPMLDDLKLQMDSVIAWMSNEKKLNS